MCVHVLFSCPVKSGGIWLVCSALRIELLHHYRTVRAAQHASILARHATPPGIARAVSLRAAIECQLLLSAGELRVAATPTAQHALRLREGLLLALIQLDGLQPHRIVHRVVCASLRLWFCLQAESRHR